MRDPLHTPECFASHLGMWAIDPDYLTRALNAIRMGAIRADGPTAMPPDMAPPGAPRAYEVTRDGVGVTSLSGPLMKPRSKYGGTSTVDARRAVRAMAQDPAVGAIMVRIDSPGGHVAGTQELADEVAAAGRVKPTHAFIEDMGASAAYWVASQADSIAANPMALVGSLGVVAYLADESKAMDAEGVKVHVVSTGPMKGRDGPGQPVTESDLADVRRLVDAMNEHFVAAVRSGRDMSAADAAKVWTGQVWPAAEAKGLGLIDRVESFDAAMERLAGPLRAKAAKAKAGRR